MAKILIGFMGAGKSTIAGLLDDRYIDLDAVITERIGMPIAHFFEKEGEAAFREIESQVLSDLVTSNHVVATGGGVVVAPLNRQLLSQNDQTIYLKADFETLYQRIANDKQNKRPLFMTNTKEAFKTIFDEREAWYRQAATHTIDVSNKLPEKIVEEISCL